jgi:mRNA (guanine-N7-)-methyltransferase
MLAKFINCIINFYKIHNFILKSTPNLNINNLRIFHNLIKKKLIINSSKNSNAKYLLDIACGRGGDIQKWISSNLNYVFAFDNHTKSIYNSIQKKDEYDGAISRFLQVKKTFKGKLPYIQFTSLDVLQDNILEILNSKDKNKIYDIVSCQFALHYFSKDDNTLDKILNLVSQKLKKGGLFIGTATNGDLINELLKIGNVNIPLLTLVKKDNNSYYFNIKEHNEINNKFSKNYFEIQGASLEFYLYKDKLIKIADKNNLELIEYKTFYEWYNELINDKTISKYDKLRLNNMSPYEMIISFLNFSFIFKKK